MEVLYPEIASFIDESHNLAASDQLDKTLFAPEWDFLKSSEDKLIAVMGKKPEPEGPGEPEYGMVLYWIHHTFIDLLDKLNIFQIPDTAISEDTYGAWLRQILSGGGIVTPGGGMVSTTKFASLDIGYASTVLYYLRTRSKLPVWGITPHPFMNNPANFSVHHSGPLKIAIFGDWGTGKWADGTLPYNPAQLVSQAVRSLTPDIVIHLGDVYYCGRPAEESDHFEGLLSPGGSFTFSLNSNHEMYDGGEGYFGTALNNKYLKAQNQTSYFSFTYGDYIFFGLDSAYYDPTPMYRSGALNQAQIQFVQNTLAATGSGKQIVVLTHHNPISYDGKKLSSYNKTGGTLAGDVYQALGGRWPDYWYYGHLHNGIVYKADKVKEQGKFQPAGRGALNLRCMGHGGIPIGKPYGLDGNELIDYCAQTLVSGGGPTLVNRVRNGFAMLTLSNDGMTEEVYEVENLPGNVVGKQLVWKK